MSIPVAAERIRAEHCSGQAIVRSIARRRLLLPILVKQCDRAPKARSPGNAAPRWHPDIPHTALPTPPHLNARRPLPRIESPDTALAARGVAVRQNRRRQPVKARDQQHVAFAKGFNGAFQSNAVGPCAAGRLTENPFGSGGVKRAIPCAAYCASPMSGQGTSIALIGAYVLAGELAAASSAHSRAFAEFENVMRPFVEANQALGLSSRLVIVIGTRHRAACIYGSFFGKCRRHRA
jgi:hypothetical protein